MQCFLEMILIECDQNNTCFFLKLLNEKLVKTSNKMSHVQISAYVDENGELRWKFTTPKTCYVMFVILCLLCIFLKKEIFYVNKSSFYLLLKKRFIVKIKGHSHDTHTKSINYANNGMFSFL